ncbi:hypothetical protein M2321_003160 [Rhodoblastus acidophilus]|nr:hypothetical protein [Rhodoblastus acidophilus]
MSATEREIKSCDSGSIRGYGTSRGVGLLLSFVVVPPATGGV